MVSAKRADAGTLTLSATARFNGVKVFSATMMNQRENLGDVVTAWIAANKHLKVTEMIVTQSSDSAFHCVTISLFYYEDLRKR